MVSLEGLEPSTSALARLCSTIKLFPPATVMAKHYWAIHVLLETDDLCFSAGPQSWPPIELRARVGRRLEGKGRLGCLFNQSPAAQTIGASWLESWSRVELGHHFILVTGMSTPQDQTSCSLASQRRHLSFKLSHFLRRLLLFYDNPSCSSTSLLGTDWFLSHSFSPLGWRLPGTRASKRT